MLPNYIFLVYVVHLYGICQWVLDTDISTVNTWEEGWRLHSQNTVNEKNIDKEKDYFIKDFQQCNI